MKIYIPEKENSQLRQSTRCFPTVQSRYKEADSLIPKDMLGIFLGPKILVEYFESLFVYQLYITLRPPNSAYNSQLEPAKYL